MYDLFYTSSRGLEKEFKICDDVSGIVSGGSYVLAIKQSDERVQGPSSGDDLTLCSLR